MLPELAGMECIIQCLACYDRETEVGHTFQFPLMYERKTPLTPLKLSLKIFLSRLVSTYKKVFLSQNFNPLTPGAFCKNMFLGHFGPVFRLDLGQISKMHLQNDSLPFLPLADHVLQHFGSRVGRNQKFFGRESDLHL